MFIIFQVMFYIAIIIIFPIVSVYQWIFGYIEPPRRVRDIKLRPDEGVPEWALDESEEPGGLDEKAMREKARAEARRRLDEDLEDVPDDDEPF